MSLRYPQLWGQGWESLMSSVPPSLQGVHIHAPSSLGYFRRRVQADLPQRGHNNCSNWILYQPFLKVSEGYPKDIYFKQITLRKPFNMKQISYLIHRPFRDKQMEYCTLSGKDDDADVTAINSKQFFQIKLDSRSSRQ